MIMNQKGLEIIKKFEGFRAHAYQDVGGVWTIGYGHTQGVQANSIISAMEGLKLLIQDIEELERDLRYVIGDAMVNENQWSALVCLVFNIGIGAFEKSSIRKYLPYSKMKAAAHFLDFIHVHGSPQPGLITRRAEEQRLFLE